MKKSLKLTVLSGIMLLSILLLSIIWNINVYAAGDIFRITNVEVTEKSGTVEMGEISFDNTTINSDVVYHKIGDYVKYKITIENKDNKTYKIKSIVDNNQNECISYEYSDYSNTDIGANSTTELYVTVRYSKEADVTNRIQEMDVKFDVILEDDDGNVVTGTISVNPKTGDSIIVPVIIFSASAIAIVVLGVASKKGKRSKKIFSIIIIMALLTPVAVNAAQDALTLSIKSKFAFEDRMVMTYKNAVTGEEETRVVKYGETISIPEKATRTGYEFLGWYDEDGNKIEGEFEVQATTDLKFVSKWKTIEYEITFDLGGGTATTPNTYTIETDEIILPQPTREGYTFIGWTSEDQTTPEKEVKIEKGSIGDKKYKANWKGIEYSINYNLNDGTLENENPSTYTPDSDNITLNNPSREGCHFIGWTGDNGTTPQTDVVIPKGSIGDKTYTANYAQYSPAALRTFNPTDSNVSWSFDSNTGEYTITQKAKSSGWGSGVVCDDSTTDINWGKNYMLEFEIQVPNTCTLKTDGNTMFVSDGSGNDIYGTSWLIVDGVRTDGNGYGKLPQNTTITGGNWHKVQMYLINNNPSQNPGHKAIRSFSGFGLDLSGTTSNVTYKMRNLKSIVY